MGVIRLVLLGLVATGAEGGACTPVDSCPKLSDGLYCPVNDVTEHADINRDVALIKRYLDDPPDYAMAKEVYTMGNSSSKGLGNMRTLQDLALKDMTVDGKYTNVFYTGALNLYNSTAAIWHNYIMACLDNTTFCQGQSDSFRRYVVNKALIGVVTAYATYEFGAAVWKGENGQTADGQAAYAWDEGAAFYIGNIDPVLGDGFSGAAPGNLYSPYEFNWKRDFDYPDGVNTHQASIPILNYGLINVRGSYNATNVKAAELAMYKIFSIAAIRSAIKYADKAYNGGTMEPKYLAEGWAYWRSASGYMSNFNATAVEAVDALFDLSQTSIPADTPCKVKTLVESLYPHLGITCAMVGKWKDATTGSCLDLPCDDAGNSATLLAGSDAYVDMCKATTTTTTGSSETSAVGRAALPAAGALAATLALSCQ
ncbi:unnamed protein product [Symbiodinium natans]|uniref:Uncharacterized protein n=1 Tax=Symbiodinium natans TaxID=878477 RepID=A0A812V3J2_9DINO|nr:unnamed protein product [Symbiodinium natans]